MHDKIKRSFVACIHVQQPVFVTYVYRRAVSAGEVWGLAMGPGESHFICLPLPLPARLAVRSQLNAAAAAAAAAASAAAAPGGSFGGFGGQFLTRRPNRGAMELSANKGSK